MGRTSRRLGFAALAIVAAACTSLDGLSGGGATPSNPDAASPDTDAGTRDPITTEPGTTDGSVPDPSLVAWYRFDEASGTTAIDSSGNGHDGLIVGNAVRDAGKQGGALFFDGSTVCVSALPAALALTTFTIAAWVTVNRFPDSGTGLYIASKTSSSGIRGWRVAADYGSVIDVGLGTDSGTQFYTSAIVPKGEWLHVAVTVQPGTLAIYVNGLPSTTKPSAPDVINDPTVPTTLGCKTTTNYFDGALDEVRIYDRVLSDAEIAALAQ